MPAKDGTGPMGIGPGTGRGMAEYAENPDPASTHPGPHRGHGMGHGRGQGFGMGFGRGRGRGGGRRRCYRGGDRAGVGPDAGPLGGELTPEQEVETLKRQAEHSKKALEDIGERIQELETRQTAQKE